MWKKVSNIKVSLVIGCLMEIIAVISVTQPIVTKETFIFETFFHISSEKSFFYI